MVLQDYDGAAQAYDQAFAIYPTIPEKQRPWRMVWYQTGPYFAYFFTRRYYDVISLATDTIDNINEPTMEESYYWRAAFTALKPAWKQEYHDNAAQISAPACKVAPRFSPTLYQMQLIGINPEHHDKTPAFCRRPYRHGQLRPPRRPRPACRCA